METSLVGKKVRLGTKEGSVQAVYVADGELRVTVAWTKAGDDNYLMGYMTTENPASLNVVHP